jgi:flagellar protein FlgJ
MKINPSQPGSVRPLRPSGPPTRQDQVDAARQLQTAYTDFVGKTFFGQMLKSMRSTVGKAAYFDGGQTEEVFKAQLEQHLADHMTKASAAKFVEPMFKKQFPQQAALLAEEDRQAAANLTDLGGLRRR